MTATGRGSCSATSTDTEELNCGEFGYPGYPWDKINYLLNNQEGEIKDAQVALWLLTNTFDGGFGTPTAAAYAMYNDALAHGEDFLPGAGPGRSGCAVR